MERGDPVPGSSMGFYDSQIRGKPAFPDASSSMMRTMTVQDLDALQPHVRAWDRLGRDAPQRLATLLPSWADACFRHGPEPKERWLCIFAYAGDRLVGVLPLIVGAHPILGLARPVLRTCDRHVTIETVALAPDQAGAALRALLAEVRRAVPNHVGIDLMSLRAESPVLKAVQDGAEGYVIHRGSRALKSYLDVRGDYESYLSTLRQMRSNIRRYRRRLESRGNVTVEIRRGPSAGEEFLDEFLELEASGWKGRGGTAILQNANSHAYHRTLVKNFAAGGDLEWYAMRVDGRLVAARLGIRCGTALMLPKVAFDEDYADCRPGTLLTAEVIKDAFSRPEIEEINHMSSAEAHRFWHMPQDEYTTLHLVRSTAVPVLFQLSRVALRSFYRDQVRPRIPQAVKDAQRQFQRRGGRRPRRAADGRFDHPREPGHDENQ
jgi:CelD/BcsL family acetyltransferase involved in cellulose biosynthesis